jgi:hypothetical protein
MEVVAERAAACFTSGEVSRRIIGLRLERTAHALDTLPAHPAAGPTDPDRTRRR